MEQCVVALNGRRSRFQALSKDPAVSALCHSADRQGGQGTALSNVLDQSTKAGIERAHSDEEKKLFTRFTELIKSTLYGPRSISVSRSRASHQLAPGPRLCDGRRPEPRMARRPNNSSCAAAKKTKMSDDVKVTFDVAKAANGIAIHPIQRPVWKR